MFSSEGPRYNSFSRPQFPNCVSPVSSGTPAPGPYAYQAHPMGNPPGAAVPPIQNQPPGAIWMPIPPPIPNCPPGLEYLTQVPAPFILSQETGSHLRSSLHLGESKKTHLSLLQLHELLLLGCCVRPLEE